MNQKQYELLACAALDYLNTGDTFAQAAERAGTSASVLARFIRDQRIDAKKFNQTLFDRLTRIKNKEILFNPKERQTHDESVKIQLVLEYLKTNEYAHMIAVRNNISNKSSIHTWRNLYFSYYNAKNDAELIDVLENKLLDLYSDCIKNTKTYDISVDYGKHKASNGFPVGLRPYVDKFGTPDIANDDLQTLRKKYIDVWQRNQMLFEQNQESLDIIYKGAGIFLLMERLQDIFNEFNRDK